MKQILHILIILMVATLNARGNALLVQEGGTCTTCTPAQYPNISAAVAAASAGDTIFIRNREGNIPWVENVAVNKSLDFAAYPNDSVFVCEGVWTITPSAGMVVNIAGMFNMSGSVIGAAPGTNTAANRCTVRLTGGQLGFVSGTFINSGYINFAFNYFDVTVYGMKIFNNTNNATVAIWHGSVMGDSIYCLSGGSASAGIAIAAAETGTGTPTTDTCFIIGNIITVSDAGSNSTSGIYWSSTSQFFNIRNNLVYTNDVAGIFVNTTQASNAVINKVFNNTTVYSGTTLAHNGLFLSCNSTSPFGTIEVQNNCVARTATGGTTTAINHPNTNGTVNDYYNMTDVNYTTKISNATGNTGNTSPASSIGANLGSTATVSAATGSLGYPASATYGIGAGNPGGLYFNIGATTNTVGCYGGSYSLTNFFPMNTGATRTWQAGFAQTANLNGNANVKATSIDR